MVALLDRLVANLPADGPGPGDRLELRRLLYGLHAILRLHFAQEEGAVPGPRRRDGRPGDGRGGGDATLRVALIAPWQLSAQAAGCRSRPVRAETCSARRCRPRR